MTPFLIRVASSASAPVNGNVMPILTTFWSANAAAPPATAAIVVMATPTFRTRRVYWNGFMGFSSLERERLTQSPESGKQHSGHPAKRSRESRQTGEIG